MRLHRLELCAFGPYAAEASVDFDALAGHGLFLLTGPTGGGKTTVLDAVSFALFGAVPGARNAAKRLRSDHAAPGARTRVVLEATLRGRRLRITREPEQERPKQRGTGTTVDKARGTLEELVGGAWTVLSTRLDEIGHELEPLVGMSRDQFCQVALLPQGDFAAFLRSDAEGRRALLQRLFATDRFERVEALLRDWRVEAARARDAVRAEIDETLARMAEAAGETERLADVVGAERLADGRGNDTRIEPLTWADDVRDTVHKMLLTARHEAAATRTAAQRARARHKSAEELATRQQQHAMALRRRAVLDEQRTEILLAETELAAARRASQVMPLLAGAVDAAAAEASVRASLAAAREDLAAEPAPGPTLAAAPPAELAQQAATLRTEVGVLKALLPLESQAAAHSAAAVGHRAAAADADERVRAHDEWLAAFATTRAQRDAALTAARGVAALTEARRDAVRLAGVRRDAAARRDSLLARRFDVRNDVAVLVDRAQEARERLFDLREQRINGMAAELAEDLLPGQPCPVCGSCEHPDPSRAAVSAVSRDDEAGADAEWQLAEQERRTAEATLAEVDTALATARAHAGGDTAVVDLDAELAGSRRALAEAEEAAAAVSAIGAEIAALDAERATRDTERTGWLTRRQAELAHAETAQTAADTAYQQAAAARGDDRSVLARMERLQRLATLAEIVVATDHDARRAQETATKSRARADKAALAAGFRDTDDAADAARDDARQAALDALVRAFAIDDAKVREQLADPSLVTAAAAPPIDVHTALVELEEVETTLRVLDRTEGAAAQAVESVTRLHEQLVDQLATCAPLDDRYALVNGLSRLAEGTSTDNERRMSLSAYVLAARLEQVAAAASARLARMSGGRYTLVHTDERDTNNKRSGLGLAVIDGWTGQQRPTSTLSGGESFFASLALALGLADVVTCEAGGAPLDTLFVDEGFGTLDEDTLDEVMDVLDGLRDGGRIVGIVSHVAELRQRIPAQLQVSKTKHGSTLSVCGVSLPA